MLINLNHIYHVDCSRAATSRDDVEIRHLEHNSTYVHMRDWNLDPHDYFYVSFKEGIVFSLVALQELVPETVLDALQDPEDDRVILYLHNTHESFLTFVSDVYEYIVKPYNIQPHKILVANNAHELIDEVRAVAKELELPELRVELVFEFEANYNKTFSYSWFNSNLPPEDMAQPLQVENIEKSFVCLSRRWRLHRPLFVAALYGSGLIDHGFVSMAPSDDGHGWRDSDEYNSIWPWIEIFCHRSDELRGSIIPKKDEIQNMPPLYLDTDNLAINKADFEWHMHTFYGRSLFTVVPETNFFANEEAVAHKNSTATFFSEKIYKPIQFKHPFIALSTPHYLKAMRDYGYKTFDGIIDESYDDIEHDLPRMVAVLREVERLCTLSESEMKDFCEGARPIVEHNYKVLASRSNYCYPMNYV